jgi:hypothetical protein
VVVVCVVIAAAACRRINVSRVIAARRRRGRVKIRPFCFWFCAELRQCFFYEVRCRNLIVAVCGTAVQRSLGWLALVVGLGRTACNFSS